jgi:streptogramin lyase
MVGGWGGAEAGRTAGAGRALAVLWCLALAACGPAGAGAAGPRAPVLYVSNARDGTIARLDAAAGRAVGPPLPAGAAPWHLAVGRDGAVLVQPAARRPR